MRKSLFFNWLFVIFVLFNSSLEVADEGYREYEVKYCVGNHLIFLKNIGYLQVLTQEEHEKVFSELEAGCTVTQKARLKR